MIILPNGQLDNQKKHITDPEIIIKTVVHFEIGCSDIDKTSEFYKAVFDWNLKKHGNSVAIDAGKEDVLYERNLN